MFDDLMNNCKKVPEFYYSDEVLNDKSYRFFQYEQTVGYQQFVINPQAHEMRGIVFDMDGNIVSRPMQKFWNWGEGNQPKTGRVILEMDKLDGTMIRTVRIGNDYVLASKKKFGDKNHPIANDAQRYLDSNIHLKQYVDFFHNLGYTVNMEFTSHWNKVVIPYAKTDMRILNMRHTQNGNMIFGDDLKKFTIDNFGIYRNENFVYYRIVNRDDISNYYHEIRKRLGTEGVVVSFQHPDGKVEFRKIKTDYYYSLFHSRGYGNFNDGKIVTSVLGGYVDDFRELHIDDIARTNRIDLLAPIISAQFIEQRNACINFVNANKHLDVKDFAKLVSSSGIKKLLHPAYFQLFRTGEFDFVKFFSENYKLFMIPEAS